MNESGDHRPRRIRRYLREFGCIPTKTLVASGRAAQFTRRAADYGVAITGSTTMDIKEVK